MSLDRAPATKRNAVRRCTVLGADGVETTERTVHCPRRERSQSFERCCGCAHMRRIEVEEDGESGSVECSLAGAQPGQDAHDKAKGGRVDVAHAAAQTRLMDMMNDDVACVRAEVTLARASELLAARGVRALPVVDEARRLVGILSKTDLLRAHEAHAGAATRAVSDAMTPLVHGLPEDAPVAYVISLMAFEGLHEVPVVSVDGRVVGMVTAVDALRWVAGSLGYVTPSRGR